VHLKNFNNIPKRYKYFNSLKNKLKRKRLEKYLECEGNAQKDKKQGDKAKSSQEITHKMPKGNFLVG
jgi:hypothetical protein